MSDPREPYLWDRSGEPDPEVERLEELLRPLAHRGELRPLPARAGQRRVVLRALPPVVMAAAAMLVGGILWFASGGVRGGWSVEAISGQPLVDGAALTGDGLLRRGGQLETDATSRARIEVGNIGRVEVAPGSRVSLIAAGAREHRLALERGAISARIWAPPRFFFVNTPSAEAIDLGCAFTLQVDDSGAGRLRVTHGWVQFAYDGREAFIPQGAIGTTRPGVGPGTPRYEDAPSGFADALDVLDFGGPDDSRRQPSLDHILTAARARDALTLWHLLSRGTPEERGRVFDRMAAMGLRPEFATREAALAGDRAMLTRWWDHFGFEGTSFWQRLISRVR